MAYGDPIESVTPRKIRRMRRLALRWLDTHSVSPRDTRFDGGNSRAGGRTTNNYAY